jgi:hypothetical protein
MIKLQLLLCGIWSIIILTVYLILSYRNFTLPFLEKKHGALIVISIALFVRLLPSTILSVGAIYDITSYEKVGSIILEGKDVYSSTETEDRHPYLPLQMYWMAISKWISELFIVSFVKLVRLAPILADAAISLLIIKILIPLKNTFNANKAGLLYALNPITIFVTAYHGQFDSIPILFILLSLLYLTSKSSLSGIFLGFGILVKSWPVLSLPVLFDKTNGLKKKIIFTLFSTALPISGIIIYSVIFNGSPRIVLEKALGYNWGIGIWGYTYIIRLLSLYSELFISIYNWLIGNGRFITLAGLTIIWFTKARKTSTYTSLLIIYVSFFSITHAFSIQYLMWVIPFAILVQEKKWLPRYTITSFIYMFLAYNTLILDMNINTILPWPLADMLLIIPSGLPTWIVCIGWIKELLFSQTGNNETLRVIEA